MRETLRVLSFDVPSSVGGEELLVKTPNHRKNANKKPALTIKTSSQNIDSTSIHEVDAYENPTELFQWINYGNYTGAAQRVLEYPIEARTWIVSRAKKNEKNKTSPQIKWRYLPLHLVCLKQNPSEQLLRALLFSFPEATKEYDHDGNLPIHYLLAEGCGHNDLLQLMLEAYPESIHKRDRKDRSPLEIVSEAFRSGKITKDGMVQMLSVLRLWTLEDDRSGVRSQSIMRQRTPRGSGDETRDPPEQPFVSFSFDLPDIPSNSRALVLSTAKQDYGYLVPRRCRSTPRARLDSDAEVDKQQSKVKAIVRSKSSIKPARNITEAKLEDTKTERDFLRETVAKLKAQTGQQEMALVTLNKQVVDNSTDLGKGKEKMRRKKLLIDDLQTQLKERDKMLAEYEETIEEMKKERKITDEQILTKDANQKEELRELMESLANTESRSKENHERLTTRMKSLELDLQTAHNKPASPGEVQAILAEATTSQSRLKARIASLERELLQALGAIEADGLHSRTPDRAKLCDERDALRMMNHALEEHVVALKERLSHLQDDEAQKQILQDHVQSLEKELLSLRMKYSSTTEELDKIKSDSLIKESKLQTKIAKVERELLDEVASRDAQLRAAASAAIRDSQHEDVEKNSIQMMNETLQAHVFALKEKCQAMEASFSELKKQNSAFAEELATVRTREQGKSDVHGIGDRQRELKSEINDLMSCIKRLNQDAPKNSDSQSTIERLQDTVQGLEIKHQNLYSQNELLRKEISALRAKNIKSLTLDKHGSISELHLASRTESYKQQLDELKEKFNTLANNNSNLRDIVAKNHGAYIQKVELLSRVNSELKAANVPLREQVRVLSTENSRLRQSLGMMSDVKTNKNRLSDLSNRLNQVAAYLIAISSLQREQTELFAMFDEGVDGSRRHWNEARGDAHLHEEVMLHGAGQDRGEILNLSSEYQEELRKRNQDNFAVSIGHQREELRAISNELGKQR